MSTPDPAVIQFPAISRCSDMMWLGVKHALAACKLHDLLHEAKVTYYHPPGVLQVLCSLQQAAAHTHHVTQCDRSTSRHSTTVHQHTTCITHNSLITLLYQSSGQISRLTTKKPWHFDIEIWTYFLNHYFIISWKLFGDNDHFGWKYTKSYYFMN